MIKHTPLVRKITYIMGFTSIILGVLSILFILGYQRWVLPQQDKSCEAWLEEIIQPLEISGTVQSITPLDDCRDQLEVANFGALEWCQCAISTEKLAPIAIGDSLFKSPQELSLTICRPDSSCFTISFPCCD